MFRPNAPSIVRYDDGDIRRLQERFVPNASVMDAVGLHMVEQVKERFRSQGASGGNPWRIKRIKEWGHDDRRAILTGASASLLRSFYGYGENNEAVVYSNCSYSKVQHLGTVGKGGAMPTIKPKRAKILFIPITDRAINSQRLTPADAQWANIKGRDPFGKSKAKRFAVKEHLAGVAPEYRQLVKGRINDDGKLERFNAKKGEWELGTPDFIFLRKVDIAPRPMLPTSPQERSDSIRLMVRALFNRKLKP